MEDSPPRGALKPLFIKNKQEGRHAIALYLIGEYSIKTLDTKEREVYIYQNGIYILAINFLKGEIESILGSTVSNNVKGEIISKIQDMTFTKRDIFEPPINLINLENGIYNLETKMLIEHSPSYYFLSKLPIAYKVEADCPIIKKFFSEVIEEEDLPIIQEWFGFLLYRDYFIKKAIIIIGEHDTGKTTFINLLNNFIGLENISSLSLQQLSSDKFATANLYNKYANSFDDLEFKDIANNKAFKMLTGKSSIPGENKFGSIFLFHNFAKLIFTCNKIPIAKDNDDEAYFSRWMVINFSKEIIEKDIFLERQLSMPEELSGLFNFALEGLYRLLERHQFSYYKDPFETKLKMQLSGSPIAKFAQESLEESAGDWISKDDLYEAFINYVKENKLTPITKEEVGKKLAGYANYIIDSKKSIKQADGKLKQVTGWRNVKIKTGEDNAMDSMDKEWNEYEG